MSEESISPNETIGWYSKIQANVKTLFIRSLVRLHAQRDFGNRATATAAIAMAAVAAASETSLSLSFLTQILLLLLSYLNAIRIFIISI